MKPGVAFAWVAAVGLGAGCTAATDSPSGGGGGSAAIDGGAGSTGSSGAAGSGGAAGSSGSSGTSGSAGTSGAAGTSGGSGASGAAGTGGSPPGGAAGSSGGAGSPAGGTAGAGGSGAVAADSLEIVLPTEGQVHVQSGVPAQAQVSFEVVAGASIASVEYVIETSFSLGTSTAAPTFPLTYPYSYPGNRWAEARGYDGTGALVATDLVNFVVQAPSSTGGCLGELDTLGVAYTPTTARGVTDAVHLGGAVNGVLFASGTSTSPTGDPIACEFVKSLWTFAEVLKGHGIVRVGTLGSYCYRCCCSWSETNYCRGPSDPEPDCGANGYSNHSWGRAVDVRYLYLADGTRYDINDPAHWVQGSSSSTCTSGLAAQSGVSLLLYTIACEASAEHAFGTVLTPNYNSAHRNHWHMDIGSSGTPSSWTVKSQWPNVDVGGPDADE